MALASYVGFVTAVDANPNALQVLKENRAKRNIQNIQVRQGDMFNMRPEQPFDCIAFCFFGNIEDIFSIAKKQCGGRIFAFKRNYRLHRFSTGTYETENYSFRNACLALNEQRIPYESQEVSLEFGQPFRDFEDAKLFYETYNRGKEPVTDSFIRERVVETGQKDYPLYMPHKRDTG